MKKIYLLGGNILNLGHLDVAKRYDSELNVIDWNENIPWLNGKHIKSDIKDRELLKKLDYRDVLFAYSSADVASYNVAEINSNAGLACPTIEMINNCIFKHKAYLCFADRKILGREYIFITDFNFQHRVKEYFKYTANFVVKPTNSSSSRGVSLLMNPSIDELLNTITKTLNEFPDGVLVDKFIGGTEYSMEMLVDHMGNIRIWPIGLKCKSIHKTSEAVSVKVIYNPILDDKFENSLIDFAIECGRSTGVRSSLLHLEVKHYNNVFYPMEIACRSSGFVATHLCDYVSNDSYLGSYIDVLHGKRISTGMTDKIDCSSIYFFYDFPNGVVQNLPNENELFSDSLLNTKYCNFPILTKGVAINKHVNDDTKKFFRVMLSPRSNSLQNYLECMERGYYAKVLGGIEYV